MEAFIQQSLFTNELTAALVAAVFATGLLTSFTPCVYPMLPITVSVVGRYSVTRSRAFMYALLYVTGLAATYAALGVAASLTGQLFGSVSSHPVALALVSLGCALMAAFMLGWLRLPNISLPVVEINPRWRGLSLFALGAGSGLVMAPCTSPVLGMLLMFIAAQGKPVEGGLLMFVFAFGMSGLLLAAGTFSGVLANLPRSGQWMNLVTRILAALMLSAALYFAYTAYQLAF